MPDSPARDPEVPGMDYTLPSGTHVRVMEPSGQAPLRASFTNANGGRSAPSPTSPYSRRPASTKPERLDYIRARTHVELGP